MPESDDDPKTLIINLAAVVAAHDLVLVPRTSLCRWARQLETLATYSIASPNAREAAAEMQSEITIWSAYHNDRWKQE